MAFVVLSSTMSFTIDMHYCGDTLVDTAVFSKADSCGMDIHNSTTDSDTAGSKEKCCDDEKVIIEGQDELKTSFNDLTFDQQLFVASFVVSYINLFEDFDKKEIFYQSYEPPAVVKDIYKLDETYLI